LTSLSVEPAGKVPVMKAAVEVLLEPMMTPGLIVTV
jgi:hypothetical protein